MPTGGIELVDTAAIVFQTICSSRSKHVCIGLLIQSTPIENSQTILLLPQDVDVVGIDEAQFFDDQIIHVCETLALRGVRVIVAGLDMDYLGRPFGQMPYLLSIADYITKLHAICVQCGNIANVSYRKTAQSGQVLVGEKDIYEPRCRICAQKGAEEKAH